MGSSRLVALRSSPWAAPSGYFGEGERVPHTLPREKMPSEQQPLANIITADEKRAVDIFMSPEYSVWRFYGDHRKPERQ